MKRYIKDMEPDKVIEKLKIGATLRGEDVTVECFNGILVKRRGDRWCINPILGNDEALYFDTADEELKLVIGRFYKTRDGSKAYVYAINSEGKFCLAVDGGDAYAVFQGGYYSEEEESDRDLIDEWVEAPKPEPKGKKSLKDRYEAYKELASKGLTISEIAKRMGERYGTIHQYITHHPELLRMITRER